MDALLQVLAFVFFIVLGQILRLIGVLPKETMKAISALVLYVTLPGAVIRVLHGIEIDVSLFSMVAVGFLVNWLVLGVAWFMSRRQSSPEMVRFAMLNLPGYNIGTFAMPYVAGFVSPAGFLAVCLFDAGNALMCTGGTFAFVGRNPEQPFFEQIKEVGKRLLSSGPICTYIFVTIMLLTHLTLPVAVMRIVNIAANANSFLAMLMIGMSINLRMSVSDLWVLLKLLFWRYSANVVIALLMYFCLPVPSDVGLALALVVFAPLPAMGIIFTMKSKLDWQLAANLNSLSVAISVIIMSVLISLLC